jgi:bifunctional non-homologous end joining protein LigD
VSLQEYRRKRDFARTPEPGAGVARARRKDLRFVIQLHHARARHFDFRLEVDGTLKSWAVPKGPSLRVGEKRLAVEVEDHPIAYGAFEGESPAGQYGAGHVRIVEQGRWQPVGDPLEAIAAGKLEFALDGRWLQGAWKLVRTGAAAPKAKWLLFKRDDEYAQDTDLDALVADGGHAWRERALAVSGARRGKTEPALQLATAREAAPGGDQWLHEIKWDGYRLLARRDGDTVKLQSRNGLDWSGRFPEIEQALKALPVESLTIDAELVALDPRGHADFARLQRALEGSQKQPISCVAFDLLALDGVDLTRVAQLQRKQLLEQLLASAPSPWVAYGQHIVGHGARVLAKALATGHEGILSKRIDAPYLDGRSQHWVKVKRRDGFDATVVGYTSPKGSRRGIGALLLAVPEKGGYRYVGRVGSGIDDATLLALARRLEHDRTDTAPVALPAHVVLPRKQIHWVEPRLVAEVEHRGWGKEGLLRQASFLRLRDDKEHVAARIDVAASPHARLTSPDRVVYPADGIAKRDVASYYEAVAPWLLPEIAGRPLSLLRAPDGIEAAMFFQKHAGPGFGSAVKSIDVREKTGARRPYLMIDDVEGLLDLVQMNAIELHPWGVLSGQPDRPDRITFDLDPGDGVRWPAVLSEARGIRDHLATVGLTSYPMLSGGKGVHVIVPLSGKDTWTAVKGFARALAQVRANDDPKRLIAVARKADRKGRIFIDWLRNGRGATSIAPWSLRARPGAPVAMPVSWAELEGARGGNDFRLAAVRSAIARQKRHPWGDYRARSQRLPHSGDRGRDQFDGK